MFTAYKHSQGGGLFRHQKNELVVKEFWWRDSIAGGFFTGKI